MSWWQAMAARTFLAFLQSTVKNPKSVEKEFALLRQVRDLITEIVGE